MKIGIDIDEVIVEYVKHYIEFCETNLNRKFPIENISQFNFWECMNISREEVVFMADKFSEEGRVERLDFVEGAKESVKLISKDDELFFITSRPPQIKEITMKFFNKHLSELDFKIIFSEKHNGNKKSKAEICRELGIYVLIEDRRKYAIDCAQNGIKVLLMDKPWNRENCEHENIIRVKNWNDILEKLEEIKNE